MAENFVRSHVLLRIWQRRFMTSTKSALIRSIISFLLELNEKGPRFP
jgi:hypothetical protein